MQYIAPQQLRVCFSIDDHWSGKHCKVSEFEISGPRDF